LLKFSIRTAQNPFRSQPSAPLAATTLIVVAIGTLLPFSPLASALGFAPLPVAYFAFLAVATIVYLWLVEVGKRFLLKRTLVSSKG